MITGNSGGESAGQIGVAQSKMKTAQATEACAERTIYWILMDARHP